VSLDVVGFAAINEDRIRYVNKAVKEHETFSPEPLGKLPYDEHFLGGSVVNTIVGLTRLGLKTALIGKLGNDESAKFLQAQLKKYKVKFFTPKVKGSSSIAYILVGKNKQRSIRINPGVNDTITLSDVTPHIDLIKRAKLVHMASFACAFGRYYSLKTEARLAKEAKKVSFSPGTLYCKYVRKTKPDLINKLLQSTDILILNKEEIKALTGRDYIKATGKLIREYGIEAIAVTLGEKGCIVANRDECHHVPAYRVRVIDTTGAGDAFTTGFLYGYLKKKSLKECGQLGNKVAAFCIQEKGAIDGLPTSLKLMSKNCLHKMQPQL